MLAIIAVLLSFITPTFQYTHYVEENATFVVQSVTPCHLYGDPDSYGLGVRISIYLQFLAALLVLISGLQNELKKIRLGFNIVATNTLISTFIGTHDGGFEYLEWYIIEQLVLFLPMFLVTPIPTCVYALILDAQEIFDERGQREREEAKSEEERKKDEEDEDYKLMIEPYRDDPFGIGWSMLIASFAIVTPIWLYFVGLDRGHRRECMAKLFIYANINMYNHHWVVFLKVMAIFGLTGVIITLPMAIFGMGLGAWKATQGEENKREKTKRVRQADRVPGNEAINEGEGGDETPRIGEKQGILRTDEDWTTLWDDWNDNLVEDIARRHQSLREKRTVLWSQRAYILLYGAWGFGLTIVWVERTLIINHIDLSSSKIYSAGQLSPLLVGIFTAVPALWKGVCQVIRERKEFREQWEKEAATARANHYQRQLKRQRQRELQRKREEEEESRQRRQQEGRGELEGSGWLPQFGNITSYLPNLGRVRARNPQNDVV